MTVEKRRPLTRRQVIEIVDYDAGTGTFRWKPRERQHFATEFSFRSWNTKHAGRVAFSQTNKQGHRTGRLFGGRELAHRVAWLVSHGEARA